MKRRSAVVALLAAALGVTGIAALPLAAQRTLTTSFEEASEAWQRGDYIAALEASIRLLSAPGSDEHIDDIALMTGELYRAFELTDDGRAARFSPDGRYILYETGLEVSRRTRIVRNDESRALVTELPGISAAISPDGTKAAFLRIEDTADIRSAASALDAASLTAQNRGALVQALAWLVLRDSTIVVRDLATSRDTEWPAPSLIKTGVVYRADGRALFFLGAREGDDTRTDIYSIADGTPPAVAVQADGLKGIPQIDPSAAALVYAVPAISPLRRPASLAAASASPVTPGGVGAGDGAARGAGPGRGGPPPGEPAGPRFAVVDLGSGKVSVIRGSGHALSADGKTIVFIGRDGANTMLMVGPTLGPHAVALRTGERIAAPALSPDGHRVAWQQFVRENWEIFVADVTAATVTGPRRLTREIQHDIQPFFVGADRLVSLMGEARHRRSYLHDLGSDTRLTPATDVGATAVAEVRRVSDPGIRLLHNNTIRTIVPEYQWAASPDGTRLVIGAERDGDTVSPRRGVYLVDTTRTVTKADLLARLKANLEGETALKTAGTRAFRPIADEVRQTLARASVDRVYGYEKILFDFDSKNITRPGNRLASEFLFNTYKSFGYEPEYQWLERRNAFGGRTANVIATLRGTVNPEIVYVISSHYDSVEAGPGADDDTSGTAALLEAARMLAGRPQPATIVFASMTGEESGLLGSREFVRLAEASKMHIVGALNNDMIGWTNDQRLDNTIRYSNPGIRDIQHAAAMLFTSLITYDALYWKNTDAMSFYDVYGDVVGGIGSYPVLGNPHYHQASDTLDTVNHRLITETSKATTATIMLLASSPSRLTGLKVENQAGGLVSVSWTASPEKGVRSYIVAYGPAESPLQRRTTVTQPRTTLPRLAPGTIVAVKAVNARGLEGWDWAKAIVPN